MRHTGKERDAERQRGTEKRCETLRDRLAALSCAKSAAVLIIYDWRVQLGERLDQLLRPSHCWWHVALMPEAMAKAAVPEDLFRDSLMARVQESATLLQAALESQLERCVN